MRPSYIRVGRYGEPDYPAEQPARLGEARLLRDGTRVAVLSTGEVASEAVAALDTLTDDGIAPAHWQFHTVKPLDVAALDAIAQCVHTLIVVEEHFPHGGLAAALYAWKAKARAGRVDRAPGAAARTCAWRHVAHGIAPAIWI